MRCILEVCLPAWCPSRGRPAKAPGRAGVCCEPSGRQREETSLSTADSGRPRVGVIGLGAMGAGMAASLRRAGFALCVHDVRAEVAQAFAQAGGTACASGKEVAQHAEVIITMVPDTPHVAAALFDPNGIARCNTPEP